MSPTCLLNKSQTFISRVNLLNKPILRLVSANMERYRKTSALSYDKLAKKIGCSQTALIRLTQGKTEFCSLSFLSCIALACEGSLIDWLRSPLPEDVNTIGKELPK